QTTTQPVTRPTDTTSAQVILRASALSKQFHMGDSVIHVLEGVDLSVRQGEFLAIEGRSGSGKSTLLHILGALEGVAAGGIQYNGHDIARFPAAERSRLRNRDFGFVFQF